LTEFCLRLPSRFESSRQHSPSIFLGSLLAWHDQIRSHVFRQDRRVEFFRGLNQKADIPFHLDLLWGRHSQDRRIAGRRDPPGGGQL
jgi:hypothetical protein